ncbi:heme-binding HmuY-like protein [Chitinophaga skermanii]|uniref:Heme-binding HmuY-like protein n=1 Tax=Chitinophaga skermanii TaxID=331697 RepID=A0A327QTB1_9BACT|nr:HmuY family protein [Chitinophaga skermanii]RAJ06653.1 heme-binding HmuY-like protein [Chitinophaga skermanii]
MNITQILKRRRFALIIGFSSFIVACSKDNSDPVPSTDLSTFVYDMPADTGASMGGSVDGKTQRPFYTITFQFSTQNKQVIRNKVDSTSLLQKGDWDIAFTKEYNSYVVTNNGTVAGTPGYGGPGKGRLVIVEKPYDQVIEAPAEDVFQRDGLAGVGWDNGNGLGWFFYSLNNHICVPIKNRTYVLKTAEGKYAKLELLNIYKGNPKVVTDLFWPSPYITFRYYVQADGSRNLKSTK